MAVSDRHAPLALMRVFVCESPEHAPALVRYFQWAGHPFVASNTDTLPASVQAIGRHGPVFELFTLPLNLSVIVDSLNRDDVRRDLETIMDLSDLPLLMVHRKKSPANHLHPERELRGILDHLPTWRPDATAGPAMHLPSSPTHVGAVNPSVMAPFSPPAEDDDSSFSLGSPNSFVG
jgi:hypothetical protein